MKPPIRIGIIGMGGFAGSHHQAIARLEENMRRFKGRTEKVAEDGPILYADTAGGDRDIVLQHLGDDPGEGWIALAARPPGVPRECTIQSRDRDEPFRLLDADGEVTDACDGREFPPDGEGLPSYPVRVDGDGRLDVDLNAAARETSTSGG